MSETINKDEIRERLLSKAREMVPALRERAAETSQLCHLPDATIREMVDSGMFRALQPAKWGGYELDPVDFYKIQMILAEGCMSTAWVYGVVGVHSWQMGLFDDRAAQDFWGDDTSKLISSSYMPIGKVTPVEGGYRLSGQWGFSSGSKHCDAVFLGAICPPEEGADADAPADARTFMVLEGEYEIVDNWDVMGLRGTGSHDIVVNDIFVPDYRTHKFSDGFNMQNPGNAVNDGTLYHLPFGAVFTRAVSTSSVGALRGALDTFIAQKAKPLPARSTRITQDPYMLQAVAKVEATINQVRNMVIIDMENMMAKLSPGGGGLSIEERLNMRQNAAMASDMCCDAMDILMKHCGGGSIFYEHPINLVFRDLHSGRTHAANAPDPCGAAFSSYVLDTSPDKDGFRSEYGFI